MQNQLVLHFFSWFFNQICFVESIFGLFVRFEDFWFLVAAQKMRDVAYVLTLAIPQNFDGQTIAEYASAFNVWYLLGILIPISGTIGMGLGALEVPKITPKYKPHRF